MANLTNIPAIDWFETTLASSWNGTVWTVSVLDVPSWTIESGETSYIVVNPWKSNMQVAKIDGWDSWTKTFNVTDISVEKWNGVDYTAQSHAANSVVRFSNNYAFWKDIRTAVNSKAWTDTSNTWTWTQTFDKVITTGYTKDAIYADDTARDTAIPSPSNWMRVYNTAVWLFQKYQAGAWIDDTSWASTPNGSETVAGKREWATTAQMGTATETWETGAKLVVMNKNLVKTSSWPWDENKIVVLNASGKIDSGFLSVSSDALVKTFTAWESMSSGQMFRQWRSITWTWDTISQLTNDTNDNRWHIWYDTTNQKAGQWYTSNWWLLTQIQTQIRKVWSPIWNLTCVVRSSASGWWAIVATSSNTIAESTLLATWLWNLQNFTFNNVDIAPWTYFIELQVDRANSTSNYSNWVFTTTNPYAWGTLYTINSWWTRTSIAIDHTFTVTTTAVTEVDTKVYKANSQTTTFNKVIWSVQSTVSANATFNWVLWWVVAWYTGQTAWEIYYLKDDWTIWTTAWTVSTKVGRALSATELNFIPPL